MTFLTTLRVHAGTHSRAKALKVLDLTLPNIEPGGAYRCFVARDRNTGEFGQLHFMNAIYATALFGAFRDLGEQRAFDGASKMLDYMWGFWRGKGFTYADRNTVQGAATEAPDLNGLFARPYAERYAITGDPAHKAQAERILGAIQYGFWNVGSDKHVNEELAHSQCTEGYVQQGDAA